jgi:hypothetical protein
LLEYILKDRTHDALCNIQAGYALEKLDPYHRCIQFTVHGDETGRLCGTMMGQAFAQWAGLDVDARDQSLRTAAPSNIPFFVWLEDHPICTALKSEDISFSDMNDGLTVKDVTPVGYGKSAWGSIFVVTPTLGKLMSLSLERWNDGRGETMAFHTHTPEYARAKEPNCAAYVWTKDQVIFAGNHTAGKLHHSTFVSGAKVLCAGMIGVEMGKVVSVDNNSGHYWPDSRKHLLPFVNWLRLQGVFAPNATVAGIGVANEQALKVDDWVRQVAGA